MPALTFQTLSDELIEHAEAAKYYFTNLGYRVKIEHYALEFPNTPTLLCKRGPTTLIVEVNGRLPMTSLKNWVAYAKGKNSETQVAVVIPQSVRMNETDFAMLQEIHAGLYVSGPNGLQERLIPADLTLDVGLPQRESLPNWLQKLLGSVYQKFERYMWAEGLEEASKVLEKQCRKHLIQGLRSTRILVLKVNGSPMSITEVQANRMTMGQLLYAFANIQTPNATDVMITKVLTLIKDDRDSWTHDNDNPKTIRRMRNHATAHMFRIINTLKQIGR